VNPLPIQPPDDIRGDLKLIADMVERSSRVLDIGCGDGALLAHLANVRDVDGRGMEMRQAGVNACVGRGLSVIQGDADTDLRDYPDQSFDYVILSLTLQATRNPRVVLDEMLRIGRRAIVSFPNFGHWRVRLWLLLKGTMPMSEALDDPWWATPNIHLCTIRDFDDLCHDLGIRIERHGAVSGRAADGGYRPIGFWTNLFGEQAVYLLSRKKR
jgi:methionine biosynthesis protein MetW